MHDLTDEEQQLYDMVCEFADTVVARGVRSDTRHRRGTGAPPTRNRVLTRGLCASADVRGS